MVARALSSQEVGFVARERAKDSSIVLTGSGTNGLIFGVNVLHPFHNVLLFCQQASGHRRVTAFSWTPQSLRIIESIVATLVCSANLP